MFWIHREIITYLKHTMEQELHELPFQFQNNLKASILKRVSYVEDDLSEDEKEFLWLVRVGDREGIQALIQANENLNVDCCDYRGRRALELAVSQHDIDLVEFLLDELRIGVIHYYCAVLRAVFENDANILEFLLDRADEDAELRPQIHSLIAGDSECNGCLPEVVASNMTPIMAAATKGNLETTRLLVERGYTVPKPHSPKCRCEEKCRKLELLENEADNGESLTESMARMNAYRALASPVYLILTSEDPILSAFELSRDLQILSNALPENQSEYQELSKQCSLFATALLNQCRNTDEVKTVLSQKSGLDDPRSHEFSRLQLAVMYSQKEFVTHANCQQVLRSMWVAGLPLWDRWSLRQKVLHVLKHACLTPIVCLCFTIIPRAEVFGPLRVPLHRFIYSATSYLVFLNLLLVTLLNDRRLDIKSPVTWTEIVVCCFVIGHIWGIVTHLISVGMANYFRSWWSTFDLIMFSLFLLTEVFWYSVFFFSVLTDSDSMSNRMTWPWYHPILLGEGIYAMASIMAFSRVLLWCHINSRLGPLGTSIKHMIGDVCRFFVIFFVVIFAFATGINSIYKNYKESSRIENYEVTDQPDAFLTLRSTFKSLFWAIFGMGEPEYAQIVVSANISANASEGVKHIFTEGVGYGLWGLYHIVTVVVLLNMLIAMMAESYQSVQTNADLEWKFACSTIWLSVFNNHGIVPPPYNLIPSMHRLVIFGRWILKRITGKSTEKLSWSLKRCCYWEHKTNSTSQKTEKEKYDKLMIQLIRRYLHCTCLQQALSCSTSSMSDELKEKIKSEIMEDLLRMTKLPSRKPTRKKVVKKSNLCTVARVTARNTIDALKQNLQFGNTQI